MRNATWQDIWKRRPDSGPLHVVNGYDLLTEAEWANLVTEVTRPVSVGGSVVEFGCGAGAFLATLQQLHPGLRVAGMDYADTLIATARARVPGDFLVHDITAPCPFRDGAFDTAAAFGVLNYLDGPDAAERTLREMIRVSKGDVYAGEINDAAKRDVADRIRATTHAPKWNDQQYFDKQFFRDFAAGAGMRCSIVDHDALNVGDYQAARYRYSVHLTRLA